MKTFKGGKNSKELGIDTTRRFIVVNNYNDDTKNGNILKINKDDDTDCPFFNDLTLGRISVPYYWNELYYADSPSLRDMINSGEYENI